MMKERSIMTFLNKIVILIFVSLVFINTASASSGVNIIPKPQKTTFIPGEFTFNKGTTFIYQDNKLKGSVDLIRNEMKSRFGLDLKSLLVDKISNLAKNTIYLEISKNMEEEAYTLKIEKDRIVCKASSETGLFYGLQSLIQTINKENGKIKASGVFVEDKPAYGWRGYMLDEARHFFGKETVKQYLDIMATLKLNRFHWHLTDEQAWRIEIKKYPLLTEIGATGSWSDRNAPRAFYTQEDIKEIVKYAADRHIMVIPEIDMPGHATAASRAYPEISGGGEGRWAGFTFHPTKEYTYEFIDNILTEVAALFPAPYIHIGGDEVHYGNQSWFTDPLIQKFIKDNDLKNEVGLEHYFVRKACEIVNSKGKKMIGWDEITKTGVTPEDAIVMWWRHDKPEMLTQALEGGFDVILTPRVPYYFDFVQDDSHKIGRRWSKAFSELHTVYNFPSDIKKIPANQQHQIMGLQANTWTERITKKERLDFMVFPRLLAVAENAWTLPELLDYKDFESRLKAYIPYLKSLGINFFNLFDKDSSPEPWGPQTEDVIAEG